MVKLDTYHYHEALDRTDMISRIFHEHIVEHTAVKATPELKAKAEEIADALGALYQMCGNAACEFDEAQDK
ncbi:hypothetical protein GM415_16015 [Pseudodesulfovibrio cashew]|uniref:Uncharacterized protein n=1 Tax=Pseudodesulfovibrio cashew TaxID=2678688 RepID=A0A6I6JMS8_9BACT|nr:hypothetical protein [Pseudodesulfovibrio cashew]QGY41562.1 hypothetical protein GM415_16015 [Pseudodesulfovibrio cashew]